MRAWGITGEKVAIPYRWNAIGYTGGDYFKAPKRPKKEEKYVELTMFDVIRQCEKYIESDWSDKHKPGSESAKYPKIIADVKRDLVAVEEEITNAKSNITVIDRRRMVLQSTSSKTVKEMADLNELIKLRMLLNQDKNTAI